MPPGCKDTIPCSAAAVPVGGFSPSPFPVSPPRWGRGKPEAGLGCLPFFPHLCPSLHGLCRPPGVPLSGPVHNPEIVNRPPRPPSADCTGAVKDQARRGFSASLTAPARKNCPAGLTSCPFRGMLVFRGRCRSPLGGPPDLEFRVSVTLGKAPWSYRPGSFFCAACSLARALPELLDSRPLPRRTQQNLCLFCCVCVGFLLAAF